MAKKQKSEKVIESVELKEPVKVLNFDRIGYRITNENLTVDRYLKIVEITPSLGRFFNVKYKTIKKDELESKE